MGIREGQIGTAFQLQTINRATYRSWFAGIGAGLDYYRFRTIPLFIDFRKTFGKRPDKLFVYADFGVSYGWLKDNQKNLYLPYDHYSNGFYNDLGFGYSVDLGKSNRVLISLGYSCKKLTETYRAGGICGNYMLSESPMQRIGYSLDRMSVKIGWSF